MQGEVNKTGGELIEFKSAKINTLQHVNICTSFYLTLIYHFTFPLFTRLSSLFTLLLFLFFSHSFSLIYAPSLTFLLLLLLRIYLSLYLFTTAYSSSLLSLWSLFLLLLLLPHPDSPLPSSTSHPLPVTSSPPSHNPRYIKAEADDIFSSFCLRV